MLLFGAAVFAAGHAVAFFFEAGIERYFGLSSHAAIVFVGHSQVLLGIDHLKIGKALRVPTAMLAANGIDAGDRLALLQCFFSRPQSVKAVVYGVDDALFSGEGLSSNSYTQLLPLMDDPSVNAYVRARFPSLAAYWRARTYPPLRYDDTTLWVGVRGWLGLYDNYKIRALDDNDLRARAQVWHRPLSINPRQYAYFEQTIDLVRQKGCKLILVNMPVVDVLVRQDHDRREAVREIFLQASRTTPDITYFDLSEAFSSDHRLFYDPIHMNTDGRELVSAALTQELSKLLNGSVKMARTR
jgi:hypothetical protein